MNWYFLAAAALAFLVGLVHSVLGERMIFRRLRQGSVIPSQGGKLLGEGHVRILWASWHVLTAFGWGIASVLAWLALQPSNAASQLFITQAVVVSMLAGALLVFVGTKARHPGWAGLLGVAVLVWLGRPA
jgi:branched-subunit amino acid ABC-type transport system permease component